MNKLAILMPSAGGVASWDSGLAMFVAIGVCIGIAVVAHLQSCYRAIPREHRAMRPAMVWLMLIPIFGLGWSFQVFLGLSESNKRALEGRGEQVSDSDTGSTAGLWFCICSLLSPVPGIGGAAGLAATVLLFVYIYTASSLKARILLPSM